jgi:uncharacterized protein
MSKQQEIKEIIAEIKPQLEKEYSVKKIAIFGSVVRKKESKDSDIDILVEFRSPISLFRFMDLEEVLESRLGKKVDLVTKDALKPIIGKHIMQEAAYL